MKKSDDLKTLVEYVNMKDNTLKEEFLSEVNSLFEALRSDPDFKGPVGVAGKDGDQGEQGPRGPVGPMPMFEFDQNIGRLRIQTGNLINEETGDTSPAWSDWMNIKGSDGLIGETGPMGPQGEVGERGLIGETGPMGPQGPAGESLTFDMLTEDQIAKITGPVGQQGEKGDKGDPGDFPKWQGDPENHRIRFQVSEDVLNPWGEWLDLPRGEKGDQGEKGDKGDPFVFENFTQQQIMMITGPKGETGEKGEKGEPGETGPKGPMGERGPQGVPGPAGSNGEDFNPKLFADAHKKFEEKLRKGLQDIRKKALDEIEKLRRTNELILSSIGKPNELMVPINAENGDGLDPSGIDDRPIGTVIRLPVESGFRSGTPVFLDNPIRASIRVARGIGPAYDPDHFLVTADARDISTAADGLAVTQSRTEKNYVIVVRVGRVVIDPRLIVGANELVPGEYYYLANPQDPSISIGPTNNDGAITNNPPQFGVRQLVGQATSKTELYVNMNQDPVDLNRSPLNLQGANGARIAPPTTDRGQEGDEAGDVTFDDNYVYYCIANWADSRGTASIWKRSPLQSGW